MALLMRFSWYLLPIFLYQCDNYLISTKFHWITFAGACFWLGEIGYRLWAGWAIGEMLEQRNGIRSKQDMKIMHLQQDLSAASKDATRSRKVQSTIDDLRHRLGTVRSDLRKARQYIDQMTDFYGPLPTKERKRK